MTMAIRKRAIDDADGADASSFTSPKRSRRDVATVAASSSSSSTSHLRISPTGPEVSASWSSSSPSKFARSISIFPTMTPKKTPYTPYPPQPSDSPSNPFGRKRTQRLIRSLPPQTSFSKHVALRFQLVRLPQKGTSRSAANAMASSHRQGGVYRIARVPLSYTFVHLRCLVSWLFDVPASYSNTHHAQLEAADYLFEVKNKIDIYGPLYKPGQIKAKSGVTVAKLSNVHDPARRWKSKYGLPLGADDEDEDQEDELSQEDDAASERDEDATMDNDDDWKWADEEDFTLGHCFPQGLKGDTGIIYHHSPTTQIHITVNKNLLPRQRGISNTPYVFGARGYVHLSPAPLPRPLFSKSILNTLSSSPAPAVALLPTRGRGSTALPFPSRPGRSEAPPAALSQGRGIKPAAALKGKSKPVVTLKSPTPPPRKATSRAKRLKSPPPPAAIEEDLTDTDAHGEAEHEEEEEDDNDLHDFDSTHPFFYTQGSSTCRPGRATAKIGESKNDRPEVIYVVDSDDEQDKENDDDDDEVIIISDSDEGSVAEEDLSQTSLPRHLREDWNKLVDSEKYNDPPYLFAKYLLEYMDPKGYQSLCEAIKKGELDEEEVFTGGVDGREAEDPFDDDDDDDDDVEVVKKGKGKEKEKKHVDKGKQKVIDLDEEDDEDEDMEPSLHVIEDDIDDEEDDLVELQAGGDTQISAAGSTPGLTNATSVSSSSPLPPSSPPRNSSPGPSADVEVATGDRESSSHPYSLSNSAFSLSTSSLPDILMSSEVILSEHYPNKKYTYTPAPPKGRTKRMRLERLVKRLERAKKGAYLSKYDEKEVEAKDREEEVDELADDNDDNVSEEL